MKTKWVHPLVAVLVLACAAAFGTTAVGAEKDHFKYYDDASYTATVTKELNEMEALYKVAISKKVSQGKAEQARQDMIRKARHILRHLNERNAQLSVKEGAQLTPTEVLLNIKVMGRVLDIMMQDVLPHEDEWSYTW
jgi:hypothetical protein